MAISQVEAKRKKARLKYKKPMCLSGTLYYDWVNRDKYLCIPVLDKKGDPRVCYDATGKDK